MTELPRRTEGVAVYNVSRSAGVEQVREDPLLNRTYCTYVTVRPLFMLRERTIQQPLQRGRWLSDNLYTSAVIQQLQLQILRVST
jgi:hypothetical protein